MEKLCKTAHITIPYIDNYPKFSSEDWYKLLDGFPENKISNLSWPEFETSCTAGFSLGYLDQVILLRFVIKKDHFRTKIRTINDPVHQDNCVEFFIQFAGEEGYYNIEFNCLGVGKVAYGVLRDERIFVAPPLVKTIKVWNDLHFLNGYLDWEIMLAIPAEVFSFSQLTSLKGMCCKGNFYKCGDDLPAPHYLSWTKIESALPDFHLPKFFGELNFSGYQV